MSDFSIPATVALMLVSMIFTAGVTWGIVSTRQKSSGSHIEAIVKKLEHVVSKLQDMTTEIQVGKTISARFAKDLEAQDDRIRILEEKVAKLSA